MFVKPPSTIHYCYRAWQDKFRDVKDVGVRFHERIPKSDDIKSWFPKGGLLVLDDLMAEGSEDKELLDLLTNHFYHQNITALYLCQDMFSPRVFPGTAHYIVAFKNPREQLEKKHLLLQAFPQQ